MSEIERSRLIMIKIDGMFEIGRYEPNEID